MKLSKWFHLLDVGFESPVIPIWISFLKRRPHMFSPRILHAVGSLFGRPLKVDSATSVGSQPSVARVLVELDISKSYHSQIWLGPERSGYIQQLQMEVFTCELNRVVNQDSSGYANFISHLNSDLLASDFPGAPKVISSMFPNVCVMGPLVEVSVNLISPQALFARVEEEVRMQSDWLHGSS
ncbi:hypothetical protein MA16_Dca013439 [Dendrobium catenatum]|uniref:Uncharacterized protein n=1 Tax=Dendrobium catenatum TaxID=906689 RepID=A0A2I0WPQ4_9ASPA|nr:hypothetical protein MA16_Dca013439 [Dendrobium catenatum]